MAGTASLDEARIDALDKQASRIEDVLFGDAEITKETRLKLKADLASTYAEMALAVNRLGASLKATAR